MIDYSLILATNYADKQWTLNGDYYDGLTWLSNTTKPTKEELDSQWALIEANVNAQAYIAKRKAEYPPLADLADALYHQSKGDETKLTAYLAKCEAVKTKYPKPS